MNNIKIKNKICRTCKYFKIINTQHKTHQDLFNEINNFGHFCADCTLGKKLFPMFDKDKCRFTEEEFNKLECENDN